MSARSWGEGSWKKTSPPALRRRRPSPTGMGPLIRSCKLHQCQRNQSGRHCLHQQLHRSISSNWSCPACSRSCRDLQKHHLRKGAEGPHPWHVVGPSASSRPTTIFFSSSGILDTGLGNFYELWEALRVILPGQSVLILHIFLPLSKRLNTTIIADLMENQGHLGHSSLATGHLELGTTSARNSGQLSVGQLKSGSKDHFPIWHFTGNTKCREAIRLL